MTTGRFHVVEPLSTADKKTENDFGVLLRHCVRCLELRRWTLPSSLQTRVRGETASKSLEDRTRMILKSGHKN